MNHDFSSLSEKQVVRLRARDLSEVFLASYIQEMRPEVSSLSFPDQQTQFTWVV